MKVLFSLIILIIIVGCSNNEVITRENLAKDMEIVVSTSKDSKPAWIMTLDSEQKNYPDYMLAVGIATLEAENYDISSLTKNAFLDAKVKLSESIKVRIETEISSDIKESTTGFEVTKEQKMKQTSDNYLEKAQPFDSYLEKIKVYKNKNWKTIYNYYVLYGVPLTPNAVKRKSIDTSTEKMKDSKEALKTIREMEDMIEEMNKMGYYFNFSFGPSNFTAKNFSTTDTGYDIKQNSIKNTSNLELQIGKNFYSTNVFIDSSIYTNSPITFFRTGIGIGKRLWTLGPVKLRPEISFDAIMGYGKIATLNEDRELGSMKFSSGSDIKGFGINYGVITSIKSELKLTSNVSLYGKVGYSLFSKMEKFNLKIYDKYDSSKNGSITIDNFNPVVDFNGFNLKAGIEFNF